MEARKRICSSFKRNPDDSWTSITSVRMKTPLVQVLVQINPGTIFKSGEFFLGMDVARRLDAVCGKTDADRS